jgi:hypothetical protein
MTEQSSRDASSGVQFRDDKECHLVPIEKWTKELRELRQIVLYWTQAHAKVDSRIDELCEQYDVVRLLCFSLLFY